MAGSYCKFCGHRCFVLRWIPDSIVTHFATCKAGAEHDRTQTGYDYTTAFNPFDPEQRAEYDRLMHAQKEKVSR